MKKCIILLPLKYNDGTEVPGRVINKIKREIDEVFDGHTVGGVFERRPGIVKDKSETVKGNYRMPDKKMKGDVSLEIWIVFEPEKLDVLRKMASRFARTLEQDSIYFEVVDSKVEFIEPEKESDGA